MPEAVSASTAASCLSSINTRLVQASAGLPQLDWLVITWGTAFAYWLKERTMVVGNCHKQPDSLFTRQLLTVEEIVTEWECVLVELRKSIAHYDLRFLKPLDESMLHEIGKRFKQVVTIEDGVLKGGMGSAILEFMADNEYNPQVKRVGLPDLFVQHGSVKELYHICGMDEEGIYKILISF